MDPARKVSGPLRNDGFGRKIVTQPYHDLAEINRSWHGRCFLAPGEIIGVRRITRATPRDGLRRGQIFKRGAKRRRCGVDGQMRMIHTAKFVGAGVHVHQLRLRFRDIEDAVALRRHLAEAPAHQEH